MRTRIKSVTLNSGITIYTAQYKGYGKIKNSIDFIYLLLNPLHGLKWKDIEEELYIQYGPDDNGIPYSIKRAENVINEFLIDERIDKINKISYIVYP
jgi:hypothetical protein